MNRYGGRQAGPPVACGRARLRSRIRSSPKTSRSTVSCHHLATRELGLLFWGSAIAIELTALLASFSRSVRRL